MQKAVFTPTDDLSAIADQAVAVLKTPGCVILVPTETVYGLVCRAADQAGCEKIFTLKGRAESKRLGWFLSDKNMALQHGVILNDLSAALIDKYTPGALTIIAEKSDGTTQGFRIPDHPLLLEILHRINEPLVQTSANGSGMPDVVSVPDALGQLNGEVDLVIDGGAIPPGSMGSTVVDATGDSIKILRQGKLEITAFSANDL